MAIGGTRPVILPAGSSRGKGQARHEAGQCGEIHGLPRAYRRMVGALKGSSEKFFVRSREAAAPGPPPRPARAGASWPHAPPHHLNVQGTFMVTASTWDKKKLFADGSRLRMLHDALLKIAPSHEWQLEAWAVFPNHYHFVAHSMRPAETLRRLIQELHSRTAKALNRHENSPGRKVWHNYWETHLTFESSYFARLNYVHNNPVKHGLVPVANLYPYGSAAWFERTATPAQVRTIYSFKTDDLDIEDDF